MNSKSVVIRVNQWPLLSNPLCQQERSRGCQATNDHSLKCASQCASSRVFPFYVSENAQSSQRDNRRNDQSPKSIAQYNVWRKRNQPPGNICRGNRARTGERPLRIRRLQPKLEPHYEINPGV